MVHAILSYNQGCSIALILLLAAILKTLRDERRLHKCNWFDTTRDPICRYSVAHFTRIPLLVLHAFDRLTSYLKSAGVSWGRCEMHCSLVTYRTSTSRQWPGLKMQDWAAHLITVLTICRDCETALTINRHLPCVYWLPCICMVCARFWIVPSPDDASEDISSRSSWWQVWIAILLLPVIS